MSNLQQQPTAEKSVQTHDSSGSTTVFLPIIPENTTTEVANTLVSMATGRQCCVKTVKPLNIINASNQSPSLPILSLADYTTSNGVPTASALATQAKLRPRKQDNILATNDDDISMSIDEYNQTSNDSNSTMNTTRGKASKSTSTSKNNKVQRIEPIQYGPILVKPRKHLAPTLASGRKSKDEVLPPSEDMKRRHRRDRNKEAAAKCRKKRNELREQLEKSEAMLAEQEQNLQQTIQNLNERRIQLEHVLFRHACIRKSQLPMMNTAANTLNMSKTDVKTIPTTSLLDSNNSKRVTINFTSSQDLFVNSPLTRITTNNDASSSSTTAVPMITIHILPEVAQAILGSASFDRNKLADLLQQSNATNAFITTTNNHNTLNSISTSSNINSTS